MNIIRNNGEAREFYNVLCSDMGTDSILPFHTTLCQLEPNEVSIRHMHHENEVFLITQGNGLVYGADGKSCDVNKNDIIVFDCFENHYLKAGDEGIGFISLYWADQKEIINSLSKVNQLKSSNLVILSPPPTPNGNLHLGHVSGPYLGADVLRRFTEISGGSSIYLTGSDDHQSYVNLKANQDKKTPNEVAEHYSDEIYKTFIDFGFDPDKYLTPSSNQEFKKFSTFFFKSLVDKGYIFEKETQAPFCDECNNFVSEAFISGYCPVCDSSSDGNACEACGSPNDCHDLIAPVCNVHQKKTKLKGTKKLYFDFNSQRNRLIKYTSSLELSSHLKLLCRNLLSRDLPDICVSHHTKWGTEVPVEGHEDKKIYVWLEMAAFHLYLSSSANDLDKVLDQSLFKTKNYEIVQFMGFDNSYFYTLLVPALLLAFDSSLKLPSYYITNEFLNLEDKKFSTSRGHAIWASDVISDYGSDVIRFYLSSIRPETSVTNFTINNLDEFIERFIESKLISIIDYYHSVIISDFGGVIPSSGSWNSKHKLFYKKLSSYNSDIYESYSPEYLSIRHSAQQNIALINEIYEFINECKWLSLNDDLINEYRTSVNLLGQSLYLLSYTLYPLMPSFGCSLRISFKDLPDSIWEPSSFLDVAGLELNIPILQIRNNLTPQRKVLLEEI